MTEKETLTKSLAVIGTVLVWFPLLAPVVLTTILLVQEGTFRFDYLMPAELFWFALAGGLLLLFAAWRQGAYRELIGGGLGAAAALLLGTQGLAVITGLASGEREAAGFWFILVNTLLVLFILALLATAVGGLLLLRTLFRPSELTKPSF